MDLSRERAGPSLPGHRGSSSFPRFALSRCLRLGAWGRRWRAPGDPHLPAPPGPVLTSPPGFVRPRASGAWQGVGWSEQRRPGGYSGSHSSSSFASSPAPGSFRPRPSSAQAQSSGPPPQPPVPNPRRGEPEEPCSRTGSWREELPSGRFRTPEVVCWWSWGGRFSLPWFAVAGLSVGRRRVPGPRRP